MAAHSSTLAWRVPWTEGPGGLQSTGWQRVGHDSATSLHFSDIWNKNLSDSINRYWTRKPGKEIRKQRRGSAWEKLKSS